MDKKLFSLIYIVLTFTIFSCSNSSKVTHTLSKPTHTPIAAPPVTEEIELEVPTEQNRQPIKLPDKFTVRFYRYKDTTLQSEIVELRKEVLSGEKINFETPTATTNKNAGFKNNQNSINAKFIHWKNNTDNSIWTAGRKTVNRDLKFYAVWNETFQVSFYRYKDTSLQSEIVELRKEVLSGEKINFETPTATTNKNAGFKNNQNSINAIFIHWENNDGTSSWASGQKTVNRDLKFYAVWNETFQVRFYRYKDTTLQSEIVELKKEVISGEKIDFKTPTATTNKNAGFKNNQNSINAKFIHWKNNTDNSIWTIGQKRVNSNLKFYAVWNETFQVRFYHYKDTTLQSEISSLKKEVISGEKIDFKTPTATTNKNAGFKSNQNNLDAIFIHWKNNTDNSIWTIGQKRVNSNLKFYAVWNETFQVRFYRHRDITPQNEMSTLKQIVEKGSTLNFVNPISTTNKQANLVQTGPNEQYQANFIQWLNGYDDMSWNFSNPINQDLNLYAEWAETKKEITLYQRKGFNEIKKILLLENEVFKQPTNPIPPFNKEIKTASSLLTGNEDYKAYFEGWHYEENGADKLLDFANPLPQALPSQLDLYGIWSETKYQAAKGHSGNRFQFATNSLYDYLYDNRRRNKLIKAKEIDVSQVTSMNALFINKAQFSNPMTFSLLANLDIDEITGWDVSSVTDMRQIFNGATSFNQPIGGWNVGKVKTIIHMFWKARAFKQDISNWKFSCNLIKKDTNNFVSLPLPGSNQITTIAIHPINLPKGYKRIQTFTRNHAKLNKNSPYCTPDPSP